MEQQFKKTASGIARELKIKYTWSGDGVSPLELQETYVSDGKGTIKGLLLPDNRFIGVSEEKNDNGQREKSIFEGEIILQPDHGGELKLKKTYLRNSKDLISYIYVAKSEGMKTGKTLMYSGDVFGTKDSKELEPNNMHFAKTKLEIIIKKIHK